MRPSCDNDNNNTTTNNNNNNNNNNDNNNNNNDNDNNNDSGPVAQAFNEAVLLHRNTVKVLQVLLTVHA